MTRKICEKLNLPIDTAMLTVSDEKKHNIGGSPRRFDKNTKIQLDERWKSSMPVSKKVIFGFLGGVLNKILGY